MTSAFSWQNSVSLCPLHSVLQGQICLLPQAPLDCLLLHSSPLWWKGGEGNGTPLQYFAWKIPWTEESIGLQNMGLQRVKWHDLVTKQYQKCVLSQLSYYLKPMVIHEWSYGFPHFLQFKSEFGSKEFIIWATVSFPSCFYGLYRASPSLAAKNIISLISVLTIWWCPCVESSLVLLEEGVCYDQCILLTKLC